MNRLSAGCANALGVGVIFGTCKLSEMALATASSVVPEWAADGEQGQELEVNILGVVVSGENAV